MGQPLLRLPNCQSTNSFLLQKAEEVLLHEGYSIATFHQNAGRGQQGASWESEPDKNLALSVLLRPGALDRSRLPELSMAVALAVLHALQTFVPAHSLKVKWPNDVLAGNRKLAGILLESGTDGKGQEVWVVGIGVNVLQTHFYTPQATSLALLTDTPPQPEAVLEATLRSLEAYYLRWMSRSASIRQAYHALLFGKDEKKIFEAEKLFVGIVKGVNAFGQLRVLTEEGERLFNTREVKMIL
jgi:BirA family biotin operon repressor/biotin-[acetyl-CoA-carboxylase] ligase